jgi:hypothetical protein
MKVFFHLKHFMPLAIIIIALKEGTNRYARQHIAAAKDA